MATGTTYRWGRTIKEDSDASPWPELADISISNKCSRGCDFCYRCSTSDGNLMNIEQYRRVLDQLTSHSWGPPFQVAIGGGEPTEHAQLTEILAETRKRGIIPNLTTNGENISTRQLQAIKEFCGAIAVSVTKIEPQKIRPLLYKLTKAGVRTNLHFLLSKKSLPVAISILNGDWDSVLQSSNAVIFLTHKAMGRASPDNNLCFDEDTKLFLSLTDKPSSKLRFGFDACFVPLLLKYTKIDARFVDSCECGFFSVYIDDKMNVKPCSFSEGNEFTFNLADYDFSTIWQMKLESYREKMKNLCNETCPVRKTCRGGCLFHGYLNYVNSQNEPFSFERQSNGFFTKHLQELVSL